MELRDENRIIVKYGMQQMKETENPGLLALKAALQPADSDYYFFVARADGSHYFARTYAEHEANIQKSNSEG